MNKHETSADIIAEMCSGPIPQHRRDQELLRHFADRLKAAWKREKSAIEADALAAGGMVEASRKRKLLFTITRENDNSGAAVYTNDNSGDCAKLREALSDACYAMFNFLKTQYGGYEEMANALDKAKAALAEPVRNCDRFRNAGEALEALERHCNSSGNGYIRCPVAGSTTEEVECKIAWLLAPSTERKGENNGSK